VGDIACYLGKYRYAIVEIEVSCASRNKNAIFAEGKTKLQLQLLRSNFFPTTYHLQPTPHCPMLSLTLAWFVFIYLTIFLAGILVLWIGYEMLRKYLSSTSSSQHFLCRICGASLTKPETNTILSCPSCGSLNEYNDQGGL